MSDAIDHCEECPTRVMCHHLRECQKIDCLPVASIPAPILSKLIEVAYDYINPNKALKPVPKSEALEVATAAEEALREINYHGY